MATQNPLATTPDIGHATTTHPAPAAGGLDLTNIQGDILGGLPKKTETFYFFQITNHTKFRTDLRRFVPLVKSVEQVNKDRKEIERHKCDIRPHLKPCLIPMIGVNVSFSHKGLEKLEIEHAKLNDAPFLAGQHADAQALFDPPTADGTPDWEEPFKQEIHGVFVVAGESHFSVDKKIHEIEAIFGVGGPSPSLQKLTSVVGDARPGDLSAHEHFGYLDGVSNPAIIGFDTKPPPGPGPIRPGVILLGQPGDETVARDGTVTPNPRDPWMVDGSYLVFRYLFQKVPEFDEFVYNKAQILKTPNMSRQEAADLLGARMVGRWKSGAPVDITPFDDDEELGGDPEKNNDFSFDFERDLQKLCPFAAHVRKTLPRADLDGQSLNGRTLSTEAQRIMRRGIQFGCEVTKQEKAAKKTFHGRGLLFACYQSSIANGFQFIQKSWANNSNFPFLQQTGIPAGIDPIIGQTAKPEDRKMSGVDPKDPSKILNFDQLWVVPRGGEYFFTPSIKGLTDTIAAHA